METAAACAEFGAAQERASCALRPSAARGQSWGHLARGIEHARLDRLYVAYLWFLKL